MESKPKRIAFIVFGPTGVGKSALVDSISDDFSSEIINMDIGSFYEPTTIGTAKPDWQASKVPHHMFDVITEPKNISVSEYRAKVSKLVESICAQNKLPILVGGSGFYLDALFFPPQKNLNVIDVTIPVSDDLWGQLNKIDSVRAQQIHPNDVYRIERALQIWYATGIKPSKCVPQYNPLFDHYCVVYLTRDRADLYKRINDRVHTMFEHGWIDEVKTICNDKKWKIFLQRKKVIGYNEIIDFLQKSPKEQNLSVLISSIQKRTRAYARRQEIYWRMLQKKLNAASTKKHVIEINITHDDPYKRLKSGCENLLSRDNMESKKN